MRRALARLCIRQLAGNQSYSATLPLFPYLFDEFNLYLFNVGEVAEIDKTLTLISALKERFSESTLQLGQAYAAYSVFKAYEDKIEEIKKAKED